MTWAEVYDGVDLGPVMGDPRFTLRGGRFKEVRIDVAAQRVLIIVNVGDLQVGYRRLRLRFDDARVVPDDYQRLSAAIRAEFKSDHWRRPVRSPRSRTKGSRPLLTVGTGSPFGCGHSISSRSNSVTPSSKSDR